MIFREMSDEDIIDLISQGIGPSRSSAALAEMERRAAVAISDAVRRTQQQTSRLVELSGTAGRQTTTMIRLTWAIVGLTVVLGFIAGLQLWVMLKAG
jgi:hypothetical protein